MADSMYSGDVSDSAECRLYKILNLCKVGVAASDTAMTVDLSQGGHGELYEVIYGLASGAIDILETKPHSGP